MTTRFVNCFERIGSTPDRRWSSLSKCRLRLSAVILSVLLVTVEMASAQPSYRVVNLGEIGFEPQPLDVSWFTVNGTFGLNNDTSGETGGNPPAAVFTVYDGSTYRGYVALPLGGYGQAPGIYELEGDGDVFVHDINDDGIAVGSIDGVQIGFGGAAYWDLSAASWTAKELPDSPSSWSHAVAISNDDPPTIVVQGQETHDLECTCSAGDDSPYVASWIVVLTDPSTDPPTIGDYESLAPLTCTEDTNGPDRASVARDIADAADGVVGHTETGRFLPTGCSEGPCGDGPDRAVQWSVTSPDSPLEMSDIDPDPDDAESNARGINGSGNIVGFGRTDPDDATDPCEKRAHFWSSASATEINLGNVMPSVEQEDNPSHAEALNNPATSLLEVVGWDDELELAILWEENLSDPGWDDWTAYDLHTLILGDPSETVPQAHDINDEGWIIVYARLGGAVVHHFAWLLIPTVIGDCPADIDESDVVGFSDLIEVLDDWGPCTPGLICISDLDFDGSVGFSDLLEVLDDWGPCPGSQGSADDCADYDLGENCECRDTLLDLMERGTVAEQANARCWLEHYLNSHCPLGCNGDQPNCPDDDPCGNH